MEGSNYMEMDFRQASVHEVMVLGAPGPLHLSRAASMRDLVVRGVELWGRQTLPLPAWLHDGVILGVQGGTERMLRVLRESQAEGLPVNGLWIQDWSGHIFTSFGKRVFWNWEWNPQQYPDLDKHIKSLKDEGVRLLCYISPHINARGRLFAEAERRGHFARDAAGRTQLIDMGEFDVGTVDLTSPDARTWYKGVIKRNIIEFGFGGWMADFGEYIPTDMVFSSGETGQTVHNKFAALWAQVNKEAVEEAGAQGEVFYYMRAGGSGASQPHLMAMWAGDQNVDWSVGDGLPSVVPAALSLGLSGVSRVYFDIGGYTTIDAKAPFVQHGEEVSVRMVRTKELFLRSAELAVFTPIMRTHEGNKPDSNYQVYADPPGLRAFAVLVRMFRALTPYRQHLLEETAATGLPCQRPLFLHFDDEQAYDISYQYLYGEHLLVAPVLTPNTTHKELYLPGPDTYWVHLFSGKDYRGGQMVTVAAPIGQPPVFYQKASKFAGVFSEVGRIGLDGEDDGGREEL